MKQSTKTIVLLIALLLLDVLVFVLQKFASNHAQGSTEAAYFLGLASHPWMWVALAIGPIQLWTWTRILGKVDLSLAYPITAISYPLTMAAAIVLLNEKLDWPIWLGAALITAGVWIMGTARAPAPRK